MALSTLTWRQSTMYSFTPAGANATVAEVLAAIKTMLDTESAGVGLWMANAYDAGNGWLEIRRKGSPTGTLGSFRALMFGGTSPNSAALGYSITVGTTQLYCGIAENASTTGPDVDYDTGEPYNSGKRWSKASIVVAPSSNIVKANNPFVYLIESDAAIAIMVCDASHTYSTVFGEIVEHYTGSSAWCVFNSGTPIGAISSNRDYTDWSSTQGPIAGVPNATAGNTGSSPNGYWHDGIAPRNLARTANTIGASDLFINGNTAGLAPIDIAKRTEGSAANPWGLMGVLRQLKLGPLQQNRVVLRDGSDVVQAIAMARGLSYTDGPLWFDNYR